MCDRLPARLADDCRDRDRQIGQHKQRKCHGGQNLPPGGAAKLFPFTDRRNEAENQYGQAEIQKALTDGENHRQHVHAAHEADHGSRQIDQHADPCQDRRRSDVHQHIEAGEAAAEAASYELSAVAVQHLQIAAHPAHPLADGLAEASGLLVIEHGGGAIADLLAVYNVVGGEFDVLRQEEEVPAAALFQNPVGKQKAGAGNAAACPQNGARVVEILRLAQEPQAIAGGDPVVAVVFGIAVARDDVVPGGKGFVDLAEVIAVNHVVRVKDEVGVVFPPDAAQKIAQGEALADAAAVVPFEHPRAVRVRRLGGAVGAVVRHDVDVDQPGGIILPPQAVDQISDDGLLVACGDQNGEAVKRALRQRLCLFQQRHRDVEKLVGVAGEKDHHDDIVNDFDRIHNYFLTGSGVFSGTFNKTASRMPGIAMSASSMALLASSCGS